VGCDEVEASVGERLSQGRAVRKDLDPQAHAQRSGEAARELILEAFGTMRPEIVGGRAVERGHAQHAARLDRLGRRDGRLWIFGGAAWGSEGEAQQRGQDEQGAPPAEQAAARGGGACHFSDHLGLE
jgi:hypothetical protein